MIIPLWVKAAVLASILAVAAGLAWWVHSTIWQAGYDAATDEHVAAQAKAEREQRLAVQAIERAHAEDLNRIATKYEEDRKNAEEKSKRVVADLESGVSRLRAQWRGCEATNGLPQTAAAAAELARLAELRKRDAANLVGLGARCDATIRALQSAGQVDGR